MNVAIFTAVIAFGLFFTSFEEASAANILTVCKEIGGFGSPVKIACTAKLQGEIVKGDASRLRNALRLDPQLHARGELLLDSPGGDVAEALKISKLMVEWLARATVSHDGICASACFLIWVASPIHSTKNYDMPARIGLHRPYFSKEAYAGFPVQQVNAAQTRVMRETREFLQQQNVSQRLIDEMMRRRSNDVYWLTETDLTELKALSPYMEELYVAECGFKPIPPFDPQVSQEVFKQIMLDMSKVVDCQNQAVKKRRPAQLLPN